VNLKPAVTAVGVALMLGAVATAAAGDPLSITWRDRMLTVRGGALPVPINVWYLEAYCRPGSTDRDWAETVIRHQTELLEAGPGGRRIRLRDTLEDGVVVEHMLRAGEDEVDFHLEAHNPTPRRSLAEWAQPCARVDAFTGSGSGDFRELVPEYARKCFIFVDGRLSRLPTEPWAEAARYIPGQVWAGPGVNRDDVNPRPLSVLEPSNGLIGCFSADERVIAAMAWEPWQELFQGVIGCIHSDFRIGGLAPGERKVIRGKLYVLAADVNALLERYRRDFRIDPQD
jgi:hypothetical protein